MTSSRKRRNKRDNDNESSESANSPNNSSPLQENLYKAANAVTTTKIRTEKLHSNWREHLQRVSFLVVLITMHQCQETVRDCLKDVKSVNELLSEEAIISGARAITLVIGESMCELVNITISIMLFYFLSLKPHGDFTSWPYMVSSMFIPFCLGLFFHSNRVTCTGEIELLGGDNESRTRQFPVAVIFHTLVTGCYWFMKFGMDRCERNLEVVENLKKDMAYIKKSQKDK